MSSKRVITPLVKAADSGVVLMLLPQMVAGFTALTRCALLRANALVGCPYAASAQVNASSKRSLVSCNTVAGSASYAARPATSTNMAVVASNWASDEDTS